MMLYLHGGGFTLGQSEDTAYITSRIAAENAMVVVSANCRRGLDTAHHATT
jgi:acetyl esterase